MKVYSPFDKMTKEQQLKFLYIDLISRNLVDEKTAEEDYKKDLERLRKSKKKKVKSV